MREIRRIFVHCTATLPSATVDALWNGWKKLGWKKPGYHYVVSADGKITQLQDEQLVANGVKGYNQTSVHVAYIGGIMRRTNAKDVRYRSKDVPADTRTEAQKRSLLHLLKELKERYPQATILGHRDISPDKNGNGRVDRWERIKECPCFEAKEEYREIGRP